MRYAAIDIGSNAVRLLISDVVEKEKHVDFLKTVFIRVPIRLGTDAFSDDKSISDESLVELEKAMQAFYNLIDVFKVVEYRACATAAMREAINSQEVVNYIAAKTGVSIEVVDGKEEAGLIHTIHVAETLEANKTYMYIDVGGGSTEITLFSNNRIVASSSFPVGTIRMLLGADLEPVWNNLQHWLSMHAINRKDIIGIGTGGNINKIAKMIGKKESKAITRNDIKSVYSFLSGFSYDERVSVLGLNPDRADVILPASKIFLNITKMAGINEMYVPKLGLVDGVVHALYEKNLVPKQV